MPTIDWRKRLPVDRTEFLHDMEQLGRQLPKARFLTLDGSDHHRIGPVLEVFGCQVRLHTELPPVPAGCFALRLEPELPLTIPLWLAAGYVPLATPKDIERLAEAIARQDRPPAETVQQPDDVLTFNDLALLAEDEQGQPLSHDMLAALKADVDRLGMLLSYGLGENISFGRYASVARTLDQFFKGFLQEQLRRRYRHIYTVFAGGDDLFLIGPWYDLVRLAEDLHGWFSRLTCQNPDVTFSAGLVFSRPGTPVRHLAWLAEHALEAAKTAGRNRITVASNTITWPQYSQALTLHRLMRSLSVAEPRGRAAPLNSSLVYRLLQYARMAQGSTCPNQSPGPTDLKWRAQMSYDLRRNLPLQEPADPRLLQLHQMLLNIRCPDDAAVLHIAAMLTLYLMRGATI